MITVSGWHLEGWVSGTKWKSVELPFSDCAGTKGKSLSGSTSINPSEKVNTIWFWLSEQESQVNLCTPIWSEWYDAEILFTLSSILSMSIFSDIALFSCVCIFGFNPVFLVYKKISWYCADSCVYLFVFSFPGLEKKNSLHWFLGIYLV